MKLSKRIADVAFIKPIRRELIAGAAQYSAAKKGLSRAVRRSAAAEIEAGLAELAADAAEEAEWIDAMIAQWLDAQAAQEGGYRDW